MGAVTLGQGEAWGYGTFTIKKISLLIINLSRLVGINIAGFSDWGLGIRDRESLPSPQSLAPSPQKEKFCLITLSYLISLECNFCRRELRVFPVLK
jgi:hypothetical protein